MKTLSPKEKERFEKLYDDFYSFIYEVLIPDDNITWDDHLPAWHKDDLLIELREVAQRMKEKEE